MKQAPSWNEIVKKFANNKDVRFADANLQGGAPRGHGSPGKGGWPTIRYYNKKTGPEGSDYAKKTSASMCDELGPAGGLLQQYIEEAGSTSLCSIEGPEYNGCSEKEKGFIVKAAQMTAEDREFQLNRLVAMKEKKMKSDLALWVNQRLAILQKMKSAPSSDKTEL